MARWGGGGVEGMMPPPFFGTRGRRVTDRAPPLSIASPPPTSFAYHEPRRSGPRRQLRTDDIRRSHALTPEELHQNPWKRGVSREQRKQPFERADAIDEHAVDSNANSPHLGKLGLYADEIAVLDRGLIIERGTHKDLVADGGAYAALWRAQNSERASAPAVTEARVALPRPC
jgi:hypothetical protein